MLRQNDRTQANKRVDTNRRHALPLDAWRKVGSALPAQLPLSAAVGHPQR